MEKHNLPIEGLPFFEGFREAGKAIVGMKRFEKCLEDAKGVELMSPEDEEDRGNAYDELKRGKAPDLREAMEDC